MCLVYANVRTPLPFISYETLYIFLRQVAGLVMWGLGVFQLSTFNQTAFLYPMGLLARLPLVSWLTGLAEAHQAAKCTYMLNSHRTTTILGQLRCLYVTYFN
jgi:hypothetical protein